MARRLGNSPETLKAYGDIIIEQEQREFIEKVPANDFVQNTHYIPHHPVWKDSFTTPREYLTSLREVHGATGGNKQDIAEGEVVLVHDDKPRIDWKLAVIEDVVRGNDGLVRAANILTSRVERTGQLLNCIR